MLRSHSRFVEGFATGMWQSNCYLLGDLSERTCVVVDPGQDAATRVNQRLAAHDVTCEAILLTHGHLDHLWAVPELAGELDVPVWLHPQDRWLWDEPQRAFGEDLPAAVLQQQFAVVWDPPTERLESLADGQTLQRAGLAVAVRHTPGHTPGSCVFLLDDLRPDEPVLISGDLLFAGSVGRTDFPRGSWEQQAQSLARAVLPLADETLVLPGHGPETTVEAERTGNAFLAELHR
ncbi:MAG: MBL fold metallo-hydrolase [Actinobacteria bacterium QS_5_72_10]|nr:MAG: MBL fold metallo-hydrolase [Actinobacteria bacterium QS_5_72_10]